MGGEPPFKRMRGDAEGGMGPSPKESGPGMGFNNNMRMGGPGSMDGGMGMGFNSMGGEGGPPGMGPGGGLGHGTFFRTKLCSKFRSGNCPYLTGKCKFAHSPEELRRPLQGWEGMVDPTKVKPKLEGGKAEGEGNQVGGKGS